MTPTNEISYDDTPDMTPVTPEPTLPTSNLPPDGFMVCGRGDQIGFVPSPYGTYSKDQALNLAAWLVALADPAGDRFQKFLDAVRGT